MVYHIHSTPRLSSEPSSRAHSITSPRVSTSATRPHLTTKDSSMSTIMKKLNGATEEYWGAPSPLYTPRGSVDNSRVASRAASITAPTGTTATPVNTAATSAPKKEKKGVFSKVKRALDRGTEDYWGNHSEMSTYYAAGLKI